MKIFPKNDYTIKLNNDSSSAILDLKNNTLSKEQFVTNWNGQAFIGEIKENEFEIKLSKKLFGEFCVLHGKLENKKGILEIRTGKIYKIIFVLIVLFVLSGIITVIIQNVWEVLFHLAIAILVMRYFFLELGFRLVSKRGIKRLSGIIGIKEIKKM